MMRKVLQSILVIFLGLGLLLSAQKVEAVDANRQSNVAVTNTSIVINNYEFGPGVDKIVLQTNASLRNVDASSATVTTAGITRQVTNAYLSDANGNAVKSRGGRNTSQYITLELSVSYNNDDPAQSASPFSFDLSTYRNTWVSSYVVKVEGLNVTPLYGYNSTQLNAEQEAINNKITPSANRFTERGSYSLSYAAYQPESAAGGEKNPLIVWLHGIGEAGTDINFPLLANEVNLLTEDTIQNHFTSTGIGSQRGAYVLVPQSPTAWGQNQAELMDTINQYIAAHPDIDSSRVYLIGGSNGAAMSVQMGLAYPNTFAALGPIAAPLSYQMTIADSGEEIYSLDESTLTALKDQPMWFITARSDASVPVDTNTLPYYKALLNGGATNKWLTYYESVVGTELAQEYNGHWSWIYLFHDQATGVQNTTNVVTWSGLTGMVATNPTNGGDAQAQVNGVSYNNIFDWLNAQNATN